MTTAALIALKQPAATARPQPAALRPGHRALLKLMAEQAVRNYLATAKDGADARDDLPKR